MSRFKVRRYRVKRHRGRVDPYVVPKGHPKSYGKPYRMKWDNKSGALWKPLSEADRAGVRFFLASYFGIGRVRRTDIFQASP